MVMIDSSVLVAIIVAITWLVSLKIWLSNSGRAAAAWKNRYISLKRQVEEGGSVEDFGNVLEQLPSDIRPMVEPILRSLPRQYRGIARWLLNNPQIVQAGLELLRKTQKPQVSGEAL
jgi:hypothetical protein